VGVVAHEGGYGALGANLSSSDLRGLLPQHFSALAMPVMQVGVLRVVWFGWWSGSWSFYA